MQLVIGLTDGTELAGDIISDEFIAQEFLGKEDNALASGFMALGAPDYVMNPQTVDDVFRGMKYVMELTFSDNVKVTDFNMMINGHERHIPVANIYWWELRR